jgi:hypothetical protein
MSHKYLILCIVQTSYAQAVENNLFAYVQRLKAKEQKMKNQNIGINNASTNLVKNICYAIVRE